MNHRKLRLVLATSYLALASFVCLTQGPRYFTLHEKGTDPESHTQGAILFAYRGLDVYAKSPQQLCGTPCVLSERIDKEPLTLNWSELPRPYPLGTYLYALTEAILVDVFGVSQEAVNRLSVLKQLAVAHIFFYFLTTLMAAGILHSETRSEKQRALSRLFWFVWIPLTYFEVMRFSLGGAYDAIYLLPILFAASELDEERDALKALVLLSMALLVGYRALWYAPLFAVAIYRVVKGTLWRGTKAGLFKILIVFLALTTSLMGLAILNNRIGEWPVTNQLYFAHWFQGQMPGVVVLTPMILLFGFLLKIGERLLCGCMAWIFLMVACTPQMQSWYTMAILPLYLIALKPLGKDGISTEIKWATVFIFQMLLNEFAFQTPTFGGFLIKELFQSL